MPHSCLAQDSLFGANSVNNLTKFLLTLLLWCAVSANAKILDSLIIEGLVVHQPAVVRNSAGFRNGTEFSGVDIQEAIKSLYRLGLFRSIDFYAVDETDTTATLVVKLDEFPVCDAVEFTGNKKIKTKELEDAITVRTGRVMSDELVQENTRIIKGLYEEKGYLLAEIKSSITNSKVPGNGILKFTIDEGSRVRIKRVTFMGNEAIKSKKLKRKFKTKEDRWWRTGEYKEETYREHLDSLILFYNDLGYLDAEVVKDSVRFDKNKRDIYIDITLHEGKIYYVGEFYFKGNRVLASDTLKQAIAMRRGKPFQKSKFEMTRYMVEDAYREEGYLWVRVNDSRAFRGDTIDVTFDISEGRAAVVNKVEVTGNNKTMEKVIRREIRLMPGQKYRQSKMMRSRRDILQLNFFDNVKPDLHPNEDGTIDLVFDVDEKDNVGQLSVGAAYSARDKFVGTFSTSIPNFRGAGQELNLNVEFGQSRRDFSIGFKDPWAFDRPVTLQGRVYYNRTVWSTTTTESYGFRIGAGTRLKWPDDYFRVDGLYQLSHEDEFESARNYGADSSVYVPGEGIMSRFSFTLRRNDTDIPNFPTRGSIFSLTPELAGLGGTYKYFKSTIGYDWYFPLFWKFVLGTKSKFGIIQPLPGQDGQLTISRWDLFNAGGIYTDGTIRGYPDYSFGGRSRFPASGKNMLTLSALIQFPILEQQLYLSVFGDMGNTWESLAQVDPMDTYKGVGTGVRILVPMLGLMGFDFAWRLDNPYGNPIDKKQISDRFEFHFLMNRGF